MRQTNSQSMLRHPRMRCLIASLLLCAWATMPAGSASAKDAPPNEATRATADDGSPSQPVQPLIEQGLDDNGGIVLTANQSRLLKLRVPMRTIDVTQPDVVLAKVPSATNIVLTGRKPGIAQLVVWDDQGHSQKVEITVNADVGALRDEIRKLLPDTRIEVSTAGGAIVVRGRVPSAQTADQVVQIATPFAANSKVINLLEIGGGRQVMLKVRFAEVSKDAISALGVNFGVASGVNQFGASVIGGVAPIGVAPGTAPGANLLSIPSPASNVTNFGAFGVGRTAVEVFLTALRQNNLLRVLAEPNLTVMSGSQASFLAGGEFPYPVPQNTGAGTGGTTITIEFKQFGIKLTFTPIVLGDGRIRLHVVPEVSDLDYNQSLTLNGFVLPSITTRTADTTVELAEGQTLSLAGLLSTRVNATRQMTPILGEVPILGALFRSVRYERLETELVVLVTPELVSGMNPDQVPPITGEHWRYPSEGELFWNRDLGGPMAETARQPSMNPPPRFHGTYGFAPVGAPLPSGDAAAAK